jgi:hypothetical protein
MHFTALTAATILAFTTSSQAVSTQFVLNNCTESVFLTNVNSTKSTVGPFEIKGSGGNWTTEIIGVGNSLGVTKNDRYWTTETPKLILGTSTDAGILYWTVSNVDGNPFVNETFALSSGEGNACENATT